MTASTGGISALSPSSFHLSTVSSSYVLHVDEAGDLLGDHYGAPLASATDAPIHEPEVKPDGWTPYLSRRKREFPDSGRGDFRVPALHLRHADGSTVTHWTYKGHATAPGKPELEGLPATWGKEGECETLTVTLADAARKLEIDLRYSVFPRYGAVARSWTLRNQGEREVVIEKAYSWSQDLETVEEGWDLVSLTGDWAREGRLQRRRVESGITGFQSSQGYSSHWHNPFVALVSPSTTESTGPAYGFSLIYTGSHNTVIERGSVGHVRVLMGLCDLHLSYPVPAGGSFTSPECVSVYSSNGLGGMSQLFHNLYRDHLSRSPWTHKTRPALINNWEATYFDFTTDALLGIAKRASELGVKLFVMDDGWFGKRTNDHAGLGDWDPNPDRFPNGLEPFVDAVSDLPTTNGDKVKFGIWVEPEMVNPDSELYRKHPDWALHCGSYERSLQRSQLVLNLGLAEVQDYIIDFMSRLLSSSRISYIKWDNNRAMHELAHPADAHRYILGLYRVLDALTTRFPDVLWEGCASGGGRFDPGMLYYFPQSWTSDDSDALERLYIQFGTSLVYPPSSMGCHVSVCPNHQMGRTTPLEFRAHVAMMGGSFGFELDLAKLSREEQEMIPRLVAMSERVNPLVINGALWRLQSPYTSNWPAALYTSPDGSEAVLLAYQIRSTVGLVIPRLKLAGLATKAQYEIEGIEGADKASGAVLMNVGLRLRFATEDYTSQVVWLRRL